MVLMAGIIPLSHETLLMSGNTLAVTCPVRCLDETASEEPLSGDVATTRTDISMTAPSLAPGRAVASSSHQPDPIDLLVNQITTRRGEVVTAITRRWGSAADVAACRLCAVCSCVTPDWLTCTVQVTDTVADAEASLFRDPAARAIAGRNGQPGLRVHPMSTGELE